MDDSVNDLVCMISNLLYHSDDKKLRDGGTVRLFVRMEGRRVEIILMTMKLHSARDLNHAQLGRTLESILESILVQKNVTTP